MEKHFEVLNERFGKDSLVALATVDEKGVPWVRTIDAVIYGTWDSGKFRLYKISGK